MSRVREKTRLRPIIRVFVSSTFSDLKIERDALQQRVFKKLEQICRKEGFQFQAIDLRWGVPTEAELDHRTMKICFEELRRSQELSPEPNFLILLGNRYGWRPLPEDISQAEFDRLLAAAKTGGENNQPLSGTHGKTAEQVLREWYRRDDNVLTPTSPETDSDRATLNYVLQPRTQRLGDNRDYTRTGNLQPQDTTEWLDVEQVLWSMINRAFPPDLLSHRFENIDWPRHIADVHDPQSPKRAVPQIVRFQGSATEQEIWCGALSVPDAGRHVLAFFREIEPVSQVSVSRRIRDFFDLTESHTIDEHAQTRQTALKEAIKLRLERNAVALPAAHLIPTMNPNAPVTVSTEHIDELCREVGLRLTAIIEQQITAYWRESPASTEAQVEPPADRRAARELEIERDEHLRFGTERGSRETFVGRQDQLERISQYLEDDSPLPLVVHGASGCGKTALLARAVQEVPAGKQPIVRFIGVTPRSSDLRALLRNLCQEFRQRSPIEAALSSDLRELIEEFRKHLSAATAGQPIVLFLDALDQLPEADSGRQLFWIPFGPLPSHVKLVVSCLSDRDENDPAGQPYVALQRRILPVANMLNLDALPPDEAKLLLLERWLRPAGRAVNADQRTLIERRLESQACRQPLYLKLLFEEVKLWRSYYEPPEPGDGIPAVLSNLCQRLSEAERHGASLVRFALGYIAAARRGLSETEILEILFADPDYWRQLDETSRRNNHELPSEPARIPIAIWSRLRADLAPYLTERAAPGGNVLTLYHRQVAEWIKARYVDESEWNPHGRLAAYFAKQDYFLESLEDQRARARRLPRTPRPVNIRKVDELPSQLLEVAKLFGKDAPDSPHWDAVADLVTELNFLEAKGGGSRMIFDLVRDFADVLHAIPREHPRYLILKLLDEAVRRDVHFINRHRGDYSQGLFQCLWNSGWWYDCPEAAGHHMEPERGWPDAGPHWSHAGARFSHLLETWRAQKEQADPELCWIRSLRPPVVHLGTPQRAVLRGLESAATCVAYSPDGRRIASGSGDFLWHGVGDNTVLVWGEASGAPLAVLRGHRGMVVTVTFSPDGWRIASGADDSTVRIWDASSGALLAVLGGHEYQIYGVAYSPDGERIASVDGNNTIRLWDAASGAKLAELRGWKCAVKSVAYSPDGRRIAIGTLGDNTVRIWDATSGTEMAVFRGHEYWVLSVAYSPDGQRIASGSGDGTVRVWDAVTGEQLGVMRGHTAEVTSVAYSPDGRWITSGSSDFTVRVWDAASAAELAAFRGHENKVTSVAYSPDGRRIASGAADKTVRLWDAASRTEPAVLRGHKYRINGVSYSPDGERIATGAGDRTVRIWDAASGTEFALPCRGEAAASEHCVTCVAYSPDGRQIATGAYDKTVRVWDTASSEELAVCRQGSSVLCVAYSPDGQRIASGSTDSTVRVWDAATGAQLGVLRGHKSDVNCVAYSPDGRRIAGGSIDSTVRVWDAASAAELAVFRGNEGGVSGVAFSPDALRIVSRGWWDKRVRVWDAITFTSVEILEGIGDEAAIAAGAAKFRWRALSRELEIVIEEAASGRPVAWFPTPFDHISTSPNGLAWAGSVANHLYVITLEGLPAALPSQEQHESNLAPALESSHSTTSAAELP